MRWFQHITIRALALAAACIAPAAPLFAQNSQNWIANDDDAILLDARLKQLRLGDGVRGYNTPTGPCVDMGDVILALDLPIRLDKKLRRATGWAFEERNAFTLDRDNNTVQTGNTINKLTPGLIYDTPEGWCVNATALGSWFGVKLEADTQAALLQITAENKLPVELAAERKVKAARIRPQSSFDLKSLPQSKLTYGGVKPPSVDLVVNLGVTHAPDGKTTIRREFQAFASGEIGPVAYDTRLATNSKGIPNSLRVRAYRTDPEGGLFKGVLNATTVAAGDINMKTSPLVSGSGYGRGAMVTNRPLDRPDAFDKMDFRGELPAGWEAELYRNGELLGFAQDRGDGRYEFLEVALHYGQNSFEVVLYGPQGQIRRETKTMMVGAESIPPRETWYWGGIMQDGRDLIGLDSRNFGTGGLRASLGIERGIDVRTSVQAGLHSMILSEVGRRNFFEAAVRRSVGPALLEAAGSIDSGGRMALEGQIMGQFGKTFVTAESLIARNDFRSDRIMAGLRGMHSLTVGRSIKIGRTLVPVQFDSRYIVRAGGNRSLSTTARAATNFGRHSFTSLLRWDQSWSGLGQKSADIVRLTLLANSRFGPVRVRGESQFSMAPHAQFERVSLIGEWSPKAKGPYQSLLRGEFSYEQRADKASFALGYVKRFDKFAVSANVQGDTEGRVALGVSLSFSLGPDPLRPGGIRVTSQRLATNGQVLARVYRDKNRDGIRQSDEILEPAVQLTAGMSVVGGVTNDAGAVVIDNLEPFRPMVIGVDAGSLPDPFMQPSLPGIVVVPRPGIVATIELPLVSSGEVDGTLVRAGGNPIEGADLELVDTRGNVISRTRSDFDGFFLFSSVPYGEYRLRMGKTSAEITGLVVAADRPVVLDDLAPMVNLGPVAAEPAGSSKDQ